MRKTYISKELEPYLPYLNNTGGNEPEELVRRLIEDDFLFQSNIAVAVLAVAVQAQITLLARLKIEGLLVEIK